MTTGTDYAIVIDTPFDAVVLQPVLRKAAAEHLSKATAATRTGTRGKHLERHAILTKYADRCEEIRKNEARRITSKLGLEEE